MSELLFASNTPGTPTTVTTSDVAIYTFNVKPNSYNATRIRVDLEVTTTGTSAANINTVKIKQGTATIKSMAFKPLAVVGTIPMSIEFCGDISAGGVFTVTIVAATASDAQTSYKVTSAYVNSIQ